MDGWQQRFIDYYDDSFSLAEGNGWLVISATWLSVK